MEEVFADHHAKMTTVGVGKESKMDDVFADRHGEMTTAAVAKKKDHHVAEILNHATGMSTAAAAVRSTDLEEKAVARIRGVAVRTAWKIEAVHSDNAVQAPLRDLAEVAKRDACSSCEAFGDLRSRSFYRNEFDWGPFGLIFHGAAFRRFATSTAFGTKHSYIQHYKILYHIQSKQHKRQSY